MLKIRLKQSVIERKARAGPWTAKRQERLQAAQRRQQQKQNATIASQISVGGPATTNPAAAALAASEYLPKQEPNDQSVRTLRGFSFTIEIPFDDRLGYSLPRVL